MRPAPFPEPYRSELEKIGARFVVLSAPSGDLTDPEVAPVEAAMYQSAVMRSDGEQMRQDQPVTSVVIQLEDDDLKHLQETGKFEFGVWGEGLPVFFFVPLRLPTDEEMGLVDHGEEE